MLCQSSNNIWHCSRTNFDALYSTFTHWSYISTETVNIRTRRTYTSTLRIKSALYTGTSFYRSRLALLSIATRLSTERRHNQNAHHLLWEPPRSAAKVQWSSFITTKSPFLGPEHVRGPNKGKRARDIVQFHGLLSGPTLTWSMQIREGCAA